jgi:hypothetical protein
MEISAEEEKKAGYRKHCEREKGTNQELPVAGVSRRQDIPKSRIQVKPEARPQDQGERWCVHVPLETLRAYATGSNCGQ